MMAAANHAATSTSSRSIRWLANWCMSLPPRNVSASRGHLITTLGRKSAARHRRLSQPLREFRFQAICKAPLSAKSLCYIKSRSNSVRLLSVSAAGDCCNHLAEFSWVTLLSSRWALSVSCCSFDHPSLDCCCKWFRGDGQAPIRNWSCICAHLQAVRR